MQACANKFWALMLLTIVSISAQAQEVSPYSRYGIGDISSPDFAASRSLGGLSAAYRSPLNINAANPASYPSLAFATFGIGLQSNSRWLNTAKNSYQAGDAFLEYVSMAFPLAGHGGGLSFGLLPYSSMRYDLQANETDSLGNNYTRLYSGKGRTYDFYAGYGVKVLDKVHENKITDLKTLSLGVNMAYRFGQMRYGEVLALSDNGNSINARRNTNLRVSDLVITLGAQYRTCLNCPTIPSDSTISEAKRDSIIKTTYSETPTYITFGLYGGTPTNLSGSVSSTFDRFYVSGSSVVTVDTINNTNDEKVKLNMPAQIGFGMLIGNEVKWNVGFDFKYTFWNGFNGIGSSESLVNSLRVGGGLEFRPNIEGPGFIRRTQYRVGGYYDSGFLNLNDKRISEFGMTFGLGIPMRPVKKGFDQLNIGVAAGSRGTTSNELLQETFIKVSIGFLLNAGSGYDNWFKKAKYQ
jgi:hypothetical protein